MDIMQQIYAKARKSNARIVLAEGDDPRVTAALEIIKRERIAKVITLGTDLTFKTMLPRDQKLLTKALIDIRAKDNLTEAQAKTLLEDTRWLAATMVATGKAEGMVSGNKTPTAETIRPALKVIGTTGLASSYFLMTKGHDALLFADCAFNIEPTSEQLARIGIDTATSAKRLGITPRVAFLSFSTKGSAQHAKVDLVRAAVALASKAQPKLILDGELQLDAALVPDVCARKAKGSLVNGAANVLIFPDLNSGNIGYKLAERLGGFRAVGPILQGFRAPVNDLSRGCSVEDIVDVVAITAMQAQNK